MYIWFLWLYIYVYALFSFGQRGVGIAICSIWGVGMVVFKNRNFSTVRHISCILRMNQQRAPKISLGSSSQQIRDEFENGWLSYEPFICIIQRSLKLWDSMILGCCSINFFKKRDRVVGKRCFPSQGFFSQPSQPHLLEPNVGSVESVPWPRCKYLNPLKWSRQVRQARTLWYKSASAAV